MVKQKKYIKPLTPVEFVRKMVDSGNYDMKIDFDQPHTIVVNLTPKPPHPSAENQNPKG